MKFFNWSNEDPRFSLAATYVCRWIKSITSDERDKNNEQQPCVNFSHVTLQQY